MPNLRAMRVDDDSIYLQASDGREITLTKSDIQTIYQGTSGNAATRKAATLEGVKSAIVQALGEEQVNLDQITADMSIAEMKVSLLEIT